MQEYGSRCVRLHANKSQIALPFSSQPVPWFESGRFLDEASIRPAAFLNFAVADYYIQDAGSLLPLALLDVQGSDIICDLCAAPGGKASAIAERLNTDGALLANESIRSRLDVLRYALARTGNPTYATCSFDPEFLAERLANVFDAVLVDAPCSGQMLVSKNKRDDNAFSDHQIEHCALRQKRILHSAIRMLKPGGRLIYSTCTFAIQENESQIQWLIDSYPDHWEPIEMKQLEPWASPLAKGCYRLWPHRDRCSGGFAAGLRLTRELDDQVGEVRIPHNAGATTKSKPFKRASHQSHGPSRAEQEKGKEARQVLEELGSLNGLQTVWQNGQIQGASLGVDQLQARAPDVTMQPSPLLIASGNHFVPAQSLAMLDRRFFEPTRRVELSPAQAVSFMRGDVLPKTSQQQDITGGWAVATWQDKSLGWFKSANNRWNNHLPPWARLNLENAS
jgi:16S rRNA C967 or C1407 C5-methylase (RsmB/RsmF family)